MMQILNKQMFRGLLVILLLILSWAASAQVAINSVVAENQVQFANNTNFEIGTLTIKIKLPPAKTTATVTVTLPTGIEYVPGSIVLGANATSVTQVPGSLVTAPVFTLVGVANNEAVFTIKRKITKTATAAIGGANLTDKVKAEVTGEPSDEKDSAPYKVTPPVVTVQGVTPIAATQIGVNTTTFSIRNTGVGAARTIFFSIDYPAGVTTVSFIPPAGVTLAQVGTVPTGFRNAGKPLYSLTKSMGFAGNEEVTITEVFKVAPTLCGAQVKLGYVPYWGLLATELFGDNTKVDRDITVRTYAPQLVQLYDNNKVYFKYDAGLCAATGQKLGTFYGAFKNSSTDATIYNNKLKLRQELKYFKVVNFCIIATDGTKIPIAETSNDGSASMIFDFPTNAALHTTNAALTGKDIGFTDEDGDGYLDDLKPGTEIRVCYDLVSKGKPFACNDLFINPVYYFDGEGACGALQQRGFSQNTYVWAYNRTNKSIFPAQLLLNAPEKGYLSPGMTSVAATEQLKGQTNKTNNLRYHYYMQLPSGVGLKNVVFHYTSNDDFTDTTAPTISIGNIAAGGVLSWTTPDTPPALALGKERLWGHISFELELTNCTGMGASATFPYTISLMSRNQDGTTFCPIPIVCETATIAMGCSVSCTVNGPEMLSTKVERADNSYGWTDATMATRVQRANVSPEQRRKVLPLDTVEFFAEGKQTDQAAADNLFYYVAVKKNADLLPKSIKVKVGTHEMTLQATDPGVITRANDANANYYRWNLTDALPSGVLAAGQTFSVVATYQVSNTTENQDLAEQSGITSYFYTLADKTDTAISSQGVHTNALRCGVSLIPVFDFGRTRKWNNMNGFGINGCTPSEVGGYYIHLGRNQAAGSLLYEEYRPSILMKKIVLKMPLAYKITANPVYYYTANAIQSRNGTSSSTTIPLSNWVETTEGDKRVYTYHNPTNRTDPYFLRPGMIETRFYNEWLKVTVQASCKSKEFTGTDAEKLAAATAADEVGYYQIEAEDFYYHNADESTPPSTNIANKSVFLISAKPQLLIAAQGQGSTIRANRNEQSTIFALEARNNPAPNTWVSIPDITGVEVQGLEEVDNAAGTTVIHTLTPVTSISGEKMFFLNQTIPVGATSKKYYRLKFKLTNCSQPQLKFKVYAGWNCEGNPTQGYRATCDDTFLEYTVNIAQSKKEIELGSNPTALPMCTKTPFSYVVKSTDEGDIFGANLVVTQQPGIIISDVKVEYPLGSGKVYNTDTPVDGKKIGVVTTTSKTTYKLSDILQEGSLPGSVSTNTENSQKFKVLFNVQPECDFVSGSSFDIDLEGNNLCGVPAIGPKVVAIVAGIQNATISNYNMLLSSINYVSGNANACDNGATYKVRVSVNSSVPLFAVGNDARLHIRFPQLYDIQSSDISVDRSANPQSNPASNWVDPSVVSRTTVGNDSEIIMVVPAGMKNSQYFDITVKIKQKANTLVDCTTERNIKVLTTDKITGIACPTLPPSFVCPALVVSTSPERTAVIKNDRAELSFAEVKATAMPSANKENLTIQYKVVNAATASATYNGSVVVSLYNDLNNNGLVEASEVLATHTTTQTLGAGVTSTIQNFTYLADQAQVCRLRLAIRNADNKCLCDDKDVALPTPTLGGNLVGNLSICETASATFVYNAAAPAYDSYTWSPASYLSAANTPTPTFTYSGAKLTTPLTVTYTLTVKRTNGCESSQTVTVVVTPTTATPAPNAVNLCAGNTIQSLKQYLGGLVSGTLRVYTTATATAQLADATAITDNTTYYYSAEVTGLCESIRRAILVKIVATPTVSSVYTYCAGTKVATLWDIIDPTDSDRSLKIYTVASGGTPLDRNDLLQTGNYYVADSATNGSATPTCESARVAVMVNITVVAAPTVSATTVLCPTASTHSVSFAAYATALSGNSLRWYATATATVPLTNTPTINTQVSSTTTLTAYVSQVTTAGCESPRGTVTIVVNDTTTPTLTAPAPLVTDCRNAAANIITWLGTATATDSCGVVSLTNTYSAPADFCNVPNGTLTVSFVAKDLFGNITTETRTITLVNIKAESDTFTVTHGAVATTTANSVLTNDKVGTQTATAATVSMTVVTPATGVVGSATPTLNNDGTITVPAGTKSGTYTIGYKICTKVASVTACDTATATVVVGAPEIKANSDTRTVTNGVAGGTISSVLTNDSYNGVTNPSTNSITLSWGTLPPGVVTTTTVGELKVNAGTASGTHQIPYTICDGVNSATNCSTATLTLVIGAPTITANSDTFTVTNGANGGAAGNVLTNDEYNGITNLVGNASVTLTWLTVPTGIQTHTNGDLTVAAGTASGTYAVTYKLCENLNGSNCSIATATIVVGQATLTAVGDTFTVTNGANGGAAGNVLTNDEYNGITNLVGNASVTLTWLTVPTGIQTHTNGDLTVAAGTASGTYAVTYKLCENLNGSNCSIATATIVVGQATITAKNNNYAIANGAVGGTTSNVLENDIYNGITNLVGNASITLTWNTVPAAIQTNANGTISVPAGTPSGVYTLTYTICENLNNDNCSTATVTVAVGVSLIVAEDDNDDTFKIPNGANGGTTSSVLANDTLNGVTPPNTTSITLTWTNVPTGIQTHTDGTISVPAGTPAGTYTVSYRICERLNGSNCSSATVTVVVGQATLTAVDNTFTVTNTTTTTTDSVLNNDSYNGTTGLVGNASVTLTWLNVPAGIQTNTNGSLTIPAGTASGTYAVTYRLCENLNSSNCSVATATIVVKGIATPTVTPTITANADTYTHTVSGTTYTTTSNVLTNDKVGGVTATIASVTIHTSTPTTDKPYIDAQTGLVVIPSGTPTGTHTITYYICDKVNTTLCSSPTVVTITMVGSVTTPTITANADSYTHTVSGTTYTTTSNVLTNDKVGGVTATIASVTIHTSTPTTDKPYIDAQTGLVVIPSGTPTGTHTITYYICDKVNTTLCSSPTVVTITVVATVATPTIEVTGDTYTHTVSGTTYTTTSNVLTNDKVGGVTATIASVTIHTSTPTTNKPYIDAQTGLVVIPSGTPTGTHTITYHICDKVNTSLCSSPTVVTITMVGSVTTPTITANADSYTHTISGTTYTTTSNVLTNDKVGGVTATIASVTIHTSSPTTDKPYIDAQTGLVVIPSGTPTGTHTITYHICDKVNTNLCSSPTVVTITMVGSVTTPTITANADSYTHTISGTTYTTTSNVLTNDKVGGVTATIASVTIHTSTPTTDKPYIDAQTGLVVIPSGTPTGTHTITYYICDKVNTSLCSSPTVVTITVVGSVTTPTAVTIEANGDEFNYYAVATQTTLVGNVLTNDKLNGALNPSVRSVTITTPSVSNPRAPYIHPATGDVTVPPHTPAGVYELPYTICALASPTECSTATAVVRISTIEAHNDGQHQLGTTAGGIISSVLTNDKLNGQRPAAGEVNINWIPSSLSGFTFNNDGTIDVAAGTPVGTYTIGYTLCATATPTLCSERAEVVVAVTAAVPVPPFSIMAVYDGPHYIDQGTATTVASVLANDTLDADPATTGNVSLTWNISSPVGISLNADGTVAVANTTAAGVYKVPYTICAKNGTLCATTDIEIVVIAPTVTPTIEVNGETFTYTGSPVVGNVLTNEKLNGVPNPSVRSVTISIMPPLPGVNEPYLNPETGDVIVPPATVPGAYTVTYRVCTTAAPVSCDTASVRVVVPASASTPTAAPVAADDRATTIRNTPVTIAVLANDTPNGATLPNITTTPLNGTAIVNADGSIEYRPSTNFVGTDRIVYELCDAFGQCASAVVTIEVTNGLLPYNGISIDGNERNSYFHIGGIEAYPKNVVKIFNRWGVQVFEIEHYDNVRNVFRGLSNGRVTIERGSKLPQGTYYYIIEYEDDNHQQQKETGWLYLKRN